MGRAQGSSRLVLAGMTLANAMILVDQTAVPLALPSIQQEFGISPDLVQWVLNGSLLPLAGLLVLGGRLSDLYGRRRMFLLGSVLFGGASAVGGLAPEFGVLLAARVVQGVGGAVLLPTSVAIVSAAFSSAERGRALGTMGGIAAVAGALGPTIGGALTSAISWRAVLLVNLPLLVVTLLVAVRSVPRDPPRQGRVAVDVLGALLLGVALVTIVFGLAQTQQAPLTDPTVLVPLAVAVASGVAFVLWERRHPAPLVDLGLLRRSRNYLGATVSQFLGGMGEMGLGLIFPLVLILNLKLTPLQAGLALIPTTLPMIVVAPLVGRWYDRAGGRPPLVTGFATLALSGVLLAGGVLTNSYLALLPGLLVFGVGLAIVLTANDPVSLDTVPEAEHGEASGVSATAEQFGGAVGLAGLYAVFHFVYSWRLAEAVDARGLPVIDEATGEALKAALYAAEQTGLDPARFPAALDEYLLATRAASDQGYAVVFLTVSVLSVVGLVVTARLVRRPPATVDDAAGAAHGESRTQP